MKMTEDGMVSKFVWKVLNPKFLSVKVRYAVGGVNGIKNVNPIIYIGHIS
jgi:hypothetical protein